MGPGSGLGRLLTAFLFRDAKTMISSVRYASLSVASAVLAVFLSHGIGVFYFLHKLQMPPPYRHFDIELCFATFLCVGIFALKHRSQQTRYAWFVFICSLMGYLTFAFSFTVYEWIVDPHRFLNGLKITSLDSFLMIQLGVAPTISGSWLTGALAGVLFLTIQQYYASFLRLNGGDKA
jgi:hypothetical protein